MVKDNKYEQIECKCEEEILKEREIILKKNQTIKEILD